MSTMPSFPFLLLGFIFGLKHAFEPDHIAAISLLKSAPFKRALLWSLGHTFTLFMISIFVLFFRLQLPTHVNIFAEKAVAFLLIVMGLFAFFGFFKKKRTAEKHIPVYPSFFIGMLHGVAGSAVILITIIGTFHSLLSGLLYIVIFGLGTTCGMIFASLSIAKMQRVVANYAPLYTGLFAVFTGISHLG